MNHYEEERARLRKDSRRRMRKLFLVSFAMCVVIAGFGAWAVSQLVGSIPPGTITITVDAHGGSHE